MLPATRTHERIAVLDVEDDLAGDARVRASAVTTRSAPATILLRVVALSFWSSASREFAKR
jgi:hypothetical protein